MAIHVNGDAREVPGNFSLQQLITDLKLAPERIAIELNGNVVRRDDWQRILLKDSDRVEIVHFVGGGRAAVSSRRGGRGAGTGHINSG